MSDTYFDKRTIARGREYGVKSDGTHWSRKVDEQHNALSPWREIEAVPQMPDGPRPLKLYVVANRQAEGEPHHWFLFAARRDATGFTRGQVWQVTGDAEQMVWEHAENIDSFSSSFYDWHQTVNYDLDDTQLGLVDQIARSEPPPRAKNRREVFENCQGWVIRVLQRLLTAGSITDPRTIARLQERMDSIS